MPESLIGNRAFQACFEKAKDNIIISHLSGELVYYASREEKTWTVHGSCKLTPEPKARVANTSCGLSKFFPP